MILLYKTHGATHELRTCLLHSMQTTYGMRAPVQTARKYTLPVAPHLVAVESGLVHSDVQDAGVTLVILHPVNDL